MELNPRALGYTIATIAGGFWLIFMGLSLLFGWFTNYVELLGAFHPWWSNSFSGLITIVIEHIVCGFIAGWIFALLYNHFLKKRMK